MAFTPLPVQKDFWFGGDNKVSTPIDSFNPELELRRNEKLKKLTDRINGEEHTYIKSSAEKAIEYFKKRFKEKTKIPHGKTRTKQGLGFKKRR